MGNSAALFNLILYTSCPEQIEALTSFLPKILERFPARLFFIFPASHFTLSHTTLTKKNSPLTCDLFEIATPPEEKNRSFLALLPYLMPDLPTYLLWKEDPALLRQLPEELEKISDRIVLDTTLSSNLPLAAQNILAYKETSSVEIGDLGWARIESWRHLLCTAFHSREKTAQLQNAKKVEILYHAPKSAPLRSPLVPALYLQEWLAARLSWSYRKEKITPSSAFFSYEHTEVFIKPQESPSFSHVPAGTILSFELTTHQNEHFHLFYNSTIPQQVVFHSSSPEQCALPVLFLLSQAETDYTLVKEIGCKGTSSHYLQVLSLLSQKNG